MNIDRKYVINAHNPASGRVHTSEDSVLFLAKDQAFLATLPTYRQKCIELGAAPEHIQSIDLLIERVTEYQRNIEAKVPDTHLPLEIERCIYGIGV